MINTGFERITPRLTLPAGVAIPSFAVYKWGSGANVVTDFKAYLKTTLRLIQTGRCCYCRRFLGDDIAVHLEHFLEQSVVPDVRFEIENLALSCGTCNTNKNGAFLRLCGSLERREFRRTGIKNKVAQCVALQGVFNPGTKPEARSYRWVHPHFHQYSDHLAIYKGWIFKPRSSHGRRTIKGLKLNLLGEIERRSRQERLASKTSKLALLVACLAEADRERASIIVKDLLIAINKMRDGPLA